MPQPVPKSNTDSCRRRTVRLASDTAEGLTPRTCARPGGPEVSAGVKSLKQYKSSKGARRPIALTRRRAVWSRPALSRVGSDMGFSARAAERSVTLCPRMNNRTKVLYSVGASVRRSTTGRLTPSAELRMPNVWATAGAVNPARFNASRKGAISPTASKAKGAGVCTALVSFLFTGSGPRAPLQPLLDGLSVPRVRLRGSGCQSDLPGNRPPPRGGFDLLALCSPANVGSGALWSLPKNVNGRGAIM